MSAKTSAGLHAGRDGAPAIARGARRLSPLETAAAMAVILGSLIATAMMTGMLPVVAQPAAANLPIATQAGSGIAPALPPVAVAPVPTADGADDVAGKRATPVRQDGHLSGDVAGATATGAAGAGSGALAAVPDAPAAPRPLAGNAPAPASSPAITQATAAAHARHRPASERTARQSHHGINLPPRGKTREEVIAELLRAKRDGSYTSAMEAYR